MNDITTIDYIELALAIVFPLISALYTLYVHNEDKKEREKLRKEQGRLQKKQEDIEAITQYRQVKDQEKYFKDDIVKLTVALKSDDTDAIHIAFLSLYSSFTDLFNEVNAFCALLNIGTVSSEEVLKHTGIDLVLKLAYDQCDAYATLKAAAEKSGHKNEMKRPDWNAFPEYDKFLQKRMSDKQWSNLCVKRKEVGLKL